jgi:hypothetical protein
MAVTSRAHAGAGPLTADEIAFGAAGNMGNRPIEWRGRVLSIPDHFRGRYNRLFLAASDDF